MRRTNWKTVSTLITMLTVAGCSDRVVAPEVTPSVARAFSPEGRPLLSLNTDAPANTSLTFTVNPSGGVFFIGKDAVVFPKGSICEPTSSYGPGTWDDSCTPISAPLTITATTRVQNGRSWIDFTPALRFVPTTDPLKYVLVYMSTPAATTSTDPSQFKIYYAASIGGSLVDESLTDPSLATYVDTRYGVSVRRVKHFSGYTSSSGFSCDTTTDGAVADPSCTDPTTTPP